jgi:hypothetical protein
MNCKTRGALPLLAALCLSLLAACAGGPQNVSYAPDAQAGIKTVAIVVPPEPRKYAVVNRGHPGLVLGLLGGMIVAAEQDRKETAFYQAMQFQKFSVKAMLAAGLQKKLAAAGYRAKVVDAPWEEKDGRYVLHPDKVVTDADAILVIVPTSAGFVSSGPTGDYVPAMTAVARLIDRDRKTDLYRGFHAAGLQPRADGWRYTPAKRGFSDFEELMAHPGESAAALGEIVDAVSDSVAQDLGPGAPR